MKYVNNSHSGALLKTFITVTFLAVSYQVSAVCTFRSGQGPVTYNFSVGNITVQRDAKIGSPIYTDNRDIGPVALSCSGDVNTNYYTMTYLGGIFASDKQIYATNLKGVGVQVNLAWGFLSNPPTTDNTGPSSVNIPPVRFRLYKTGDIQSGSLTVAQVGTWTVSEITPLTINLSGGSVSVIGCSVATPTLSFPIGDILKSEFGSTVGYIPAKTSVQNLGLDCDSSANINVTLSGTPNPDVSDTSVLALNNQGSANVAKGVGVQLLYDGVPLIIDNKIALRQSSGGRETFPITARYYQTKNAVTVGEASASATLTLTYQ